MDSTDGSSSSPSSSPSPSSTTTTNIARFPLKAYGNKKKFNVGKFNIGKVDTNDEKPVVLNFGAWAKPVKMYRPPAEAQSGGDHTNTEPEHNSKPNNAFKRKFMPIYKPREKEPQTWHIEDADGNNAFDGTKEGGQTASYVFLVYENNAFNVIPCGEWYNFKPRRTYQTLSLDEAEAKMSMIKARGEKAAMKMEKNPVKLETTTTAASQQPVGKDKEDEEFETNEEDPEKFSAFGRGGSDDESKNKKKAGKTKKNGEDGEDAEGDNEDEENGEEPDWKGLFDDDEEDRAGSEHDEEEPKNIRDNEADNEGEDSSLTDAGKEISKILKNHRKEDDMSDASDSLGSDSDDDDDDDFDEENLPDIKFPKLNPIGVVEEKEKRETLTPEQTTRVGTPPSTPPTNIPENEQKKKAKKSSKGKKETKAEAKESKPTTTTTTTATKKQRPPTTTTTSSTDSPPTNTSSPPVAAQKTGVKRPAEAVGETTASAAPAKKAKTGLPVTEAEVIKLLKVKGLPTKDFVKHFQSTIATNPVALKNKLSEIIKKVCTINPSKILSLKPEYASK